MDKGVWWATVHGAAASWTWLKQQHTCLHSPTFPPSLPARGPGSSKNLENLQPEISVRLLKGMDPPWWCQLPSSQKLQGFTPWEHHTWVKGPLSPNLQRNNWGNGPLWLLLWTSLWPEASLTKTNKIVSPKSKWLTAGIVALRGELVTLA